MASSLVIDLDTWICAVCKPCLKILSICDHDTISAYTKSLMEYSKKNDIKLIYGVEISTKYKVVGYYFLGYNIDINNNKF